MIKRKNKNLLAYLVLFLLLSSCSFNPHVVEDYKRSCNPNFSSVEYTEHQAITFEAVKYKSILFTYKEFPEKFRDEVGCIANHVSTSANIILAFHSPETNGLLMLLQDRENKKLTSVTITVKTKDIRLVRVEVYAPLQDALTALGGGKPKNIITQYGPIQSFMLEEDFISLMNSLSNGKFSNPE